MKYLFILLILATGLSSCGNKKTTTVPESTSDTNTTAPKNNIKKPLSDNVDWETKAIDTVMLLPEVIELGKEIDKNSKSKNRLTCMVTDSPEDNQEGYYRIKVGEGNEDKVTAIYHFHVYVPEMKIKVDDPVSGDELPLDEWRKNNKK